MCTAISTRKVRATESCAGMGSRQCGLRVYWLKALDEELHRFMNRQLEEEYPYLIPGRTLWRVRSGGDPAVEAVWLAVDWEGRRQSPGCGAGAKAPVAGTSFWD